jgi:hypothetical protein
MYERGKTCALVSEVHSAMSRVELVSLIPTPKYCSPQLAGRAGSSTQTLRRFDGGHGARPPGWGVATAVRCSSYVDQVNDEDREE